MASKNTLEIGQAAPLFTASTHEDKPFNLSDRKGKGWTVLYFYPKAETPGCIKQACAFRDSVQVIQELNAEVYGISTDTVKSQAKFHQNRQLSFTLLSDPSGEISQLYGTKLPLIKFAKRWTFIIDPDLTICSINRDVDPVLDAQAVAEELKNLQ